MTRKTALLLAIQALSEDKNNKEICDVLQQIADDLPIAHWNKTNIIDSVQVCQSLLLHQILAHRG